MTSETTDNTTNNNNNNNSAASHKDTDDYLYFLGTILERIHSAFYTTLDKVKEKGGMAKKDTEVTKFCSFGTVDPDVRIIAPELRRQTLKGCNIVFTGVVPTNVPLEKSRPWRTAVGLGARVTADVIQKKNSTEDSVFTTHVVAARHGTQKSYKASKNPDIRLVNPNWLWCASERWDRPEESIFPVPSLDGKNSPAGSRQGTPQHNSFEAQKSRKQVSPLAQEGFELPGGYDPDSFLENVNPLGSFSRGELDAMDKEVEELMQSENEHSSDEDDADNDDKGSRSSSRGSKRKRNNAKTGSGSSSSNDGENVNDKRPSKKKSKQQSNKSDSANDDESSDSDSSSSSSSSDSNDENNTRNSNDSSSSSSSNSSDESDDGEEDRLGSMLERKISESSP